MHQFVRCRPLTRQLNLPLWTFEPRVLTKPLFLCRCFFHRFVCVCVCVIVSTRARQMENVDSFLSACCKLGVPAHALVDTADIFEMRDTPRVVECVVSTSWVACLLACAPELRYPRPFEGFALVFSLRPSLSPCP